ncbi:hypothetical protein OAC57_10610 [Planktomarina temperata]|nr:hypothetical protein [Planktomarina temperata]
MSIRQKVPTSELFKGFCNNTRNLASLFFWPIPAITVNKFFTITVLVTLVPPITDELRDDIVASDNSKMAEFFVKFSDGCEISYEYTKQLNRIRNTGCNPKNFSSDAFKALLSAPEELRDGLVSSGKP